MNNNNRLVFNTIVVYAQLLISLLVGLFSVRFVLQALGEDDYGVYTVVGGVVSMLNVFTVCLSGATMRFIANSLGRGDMEATKKSFNTSLFIHCLFAIILAIVLEIGGWVMFKYVLVLPGDRILVAKWVYQFMVVSALITMISVPYDALIMAHENLSFNSLVTICSQILTLGLSIYLLYGCHSDRLFIYGFSLMIVRLLERIVKQLFCRYKYEESVVAIREYRDNNTFKNMFRFIGWDFLSNSIGIISNQFNSILINRFFGVKLNAGQGVAGQINGYVNQLSVGITSAITPQMNKSEGIGERERLIKLTKTGVKYTTFMFSLAAVPIAIELPFILKIWLGNIPTYAVEFCRMIMLIQLTSKLFFQIGNAVRAVGDIKLVTIGGATINLFTIIGSYLALKIFDAPITIYIVSFFMAIMTGMLMLYCGEKIVGINPIEYIKDTIFPFFAPLFVSAVVTLIIHFVLSEGWVRLVVLSLSFVFLFSILFYNFCIPSSKKQYFKGLIVMTYKKISQKL